MSESMGNHRKSCTQAASIEETLALWAASLREIKKRIRPLFTQERVATNAGLFLEGLFGDEQRKTGRKRAGGGWRQREFLSDLLTSQGPLYKFARLQQDVGAASGG